MADQFQLDFSLPLFTTIPFSLCYPNTVSKVSFVEEEPSLSCTCCWSCGGDGCCGGGGGGGWSESTSMAAGGLGSVLSACRAAATLFVPASASEDAPGAEPVKDDDWVVEAATAAPASANDLNSGGSSFSRSARPNWQPGGRASSEHSASNTVDSHTSELENGTQNHHPSLNFHENKLLFSTNGEGFVHKDERVTIQTQNRTGRRNLDIKRKTL